MDSDLAKQRLMLGCPREQKIGNMHVLLHIGFSFMCLWREKFGHKYHELLFTQIVYQNCLHMVEK